MKHKFLTVVFLICLTIIPTTVFAFGQVAGSIFIHVPIGGSNTGSWKIFNEEPLKVKISAEGDAKNFISFPEQVTLEPNNKIYSIEMTAKIPADYKITQGTNITGTLYALSEGSPGQVKINLQLKKNIYILVESPEPSAVAGNPLTSLITGFFSMGPAYVLSFFGLIILVEIILFIKKKGR